MSSPKPPDAGRLLRRLNAAARRLGGNEQERDELIIAAYNAGASLRAIAGEAHLSHETVRTIVARQEVTE